MKASSTKIVEGVSESEFDPNGLLTREQAAVMFSRSLKYVDQSDEIERNVPINFLGESPAFVDQKDISTWAIEGIAMAFNNGLIRFAYSNQQKPIFIRRGMSSTYLEHLTVQLPFSMGKWLQKL